MNFRNVFFALTGCVVLTACSNPADEAAAPAAAPAEAAPEPVAETAATPEGRVFFVSPADGDTVTSPVTVTARALGAHTAK